MITQPFEYIRAASVSEAVQALAHHGAQSKVLAGGQLLIPGLTSRQIALATLIDITHVPELLRIERFGDELRVGAAVTQAQVLRSELVRTHFPMLAQVAASIGDPMVRNRATLCGAALNTNPAADWLCILQLLNATLHFTDTTGFTQLHVAQADATQQLRTIAPTQLLTHVSLPLSATPMRAHYEKIRHENTGYARIGVGCAWLKPAVGAVQVRVAITGTLTRALRLHGLEQQLATFPATAWESSLMDPNQLRDLPYLGDEPDALGYHHYLTRSTLRRALGKLFSSIETQH